MYNSHSLWYIYVSWSGTAVATHSTAILQRMCTTRQTQKNNANASCFRFIIDTMEEEKTKTKTFTAHNTQCLRLNLDLLNDTPNEHFNLFCSKDCTKCPHFACYQCWIFHANMSTTHSNICIRLAHTECDCKHTSFVNECLCVWSLHVTPRKPYQQAKIIFAFFLHRFVYSGSNIELRKKIMSRSRSPAI